MRRRLVSLSLLLSASLLMAGCSEPEGGGSAAPSSPSAMGGGAEDPGDGGPEAIVAGDRLVLREDGRERVLAEIDPRSDGELVDATLRPGSHEGVTVLALTRVDERYELRYLVAEDGEVTDLYWFPWRLQVDEGLAGVADVPPLPVWSPDGSALAWIEWGDRGTRLRTVTWRDQDGANNPSDEAADFPLGGVPVGTQLTRWEDADGAPTLLAAIGERRWRIELTVADDEPGLPVARVREVETTPDRGGAAAT